MKEFPVLQVSKFVENIKFIKGHSVFVFFKVAYIKELFVSLVLLVTTVSEATVAMKSCFNIFVLSNNSKTSQVSITF